MTTAWWRWRAASSTPMKTPTTCPPSSAGQRPSDPNCVAVEKRQSLHEKIIRPKSVVQRQFLFLCGKYLSTILIDKRDDCRIICSAAIPLPVRQNTCAKSAKSYNKDDFWKPAVNCRTGNTNTKPNLWRSFLFVCICWFSSVPCDLSDWKQCNLYISSTHYQAGHLVSIWVLPALRVGSSIYSHHTGALCIRQVIVVVISLLLPEMWPLGSFLFCPCITSLKFLSCSPCAVPPFELRSGGAVVPTIASLMSWFSNPKFRGINLTDILWRFLTTSACFLY